MLLLQERNPLLFNDFLLVEFEALAVKTPESRLKLEAPDKSKPQGSPPIKQSITPRTIHPTSISLESTHPELSQKSPRGISKAWSPSYSNQDFQNLIELENKKLIESGYYRDTPRLVSPRKMYKSMPSLNKVPEDSVTQDDVRMKRTGSLQGIPDIVFA